MARFRERLTSVFDDCAVSAHEGAGHFVPEELGASLTPEIEKILGI